jgi:hypothetical protein
MTQQPLAAQGRRMKNANLFGEKDVKFVHIFSSSSVSSVCVWRAQRNHTQGRLSNRSTANNNKPILLSHKFLPELVTQCNLNFFASFSRKKLDNMGIIRKENSARGKCLVGNNIYDNHFHPRDAF